MDLQLTDRVFIVTGGARGLGRASADALVAEGARVVLSGRSRESLDEAVASLDDAAGRVAAVGVSPTTPTGPRRRASWPRPRRPGAGSTVR
jgi:3-oxoacyl-[acyl-carrier protein] reductase